jgi:hypothetical protein
VFAAATVPTPVVRSHVAVGAATVFAVTSIGGQLVGFILAPASPEHTLYAPPDQVVFYATPEWQQIAPTEARSYAALQPI